MNRLSFFVLPIVALAIGCSAPASDADTSDVDAHEADLVGIGDLGTLESSLGLVWDANRTRPEEVLRNGPCYKKMAASGREWNLRRYTTGAAFFFTGGEGNEPLSPVTCVDVEQMDGTKDQSGGRQPAIALTGLSLDIAMRFKFGRLQWFGGPQEGPHDREILAFERGSITIVPIPAEMPYTIKDNLPEYDGSFRGFITEVQAAGLPYEHRKIGPGLGMIAYRFAKATQSLSLASDPLGTFQSLEKMPDSSHYKLHFERGAVWVFPGPNGIASLSLDSYVTAVDPQMTDAHCEVRGPGQEWQCGNSLFPVVPWEITGL